MLRQCFGLVRNCGAWNRWNDPTWRSIGMEITNQSTRSRDLGRPWEFTCVENPKKEIHHVWRLDYVGLHWQPLRVWFNCWAVQTKYWCKTNSDVHSSPDDLAAKLRAPRKCIVSDSFTSSTWPVHDWCPISLRRLFKSAPFSMFWCLDSNRFA